MDLEDLVISILDRIEKADDNDADVFHICFDRKQIRDIAATYREIDYIEIY